MKNFIITLIFLGNSAVLYNALNTGLPTIFNDILLFSFLVAILMQIKLITTLFEKKSDKLKGDVVKK